MLSFITNYWWAILIGLILMIIIVIFFGNVQMNKNISREINILMEGVNNNQENDELIDEDDLKELPFSVQNWLKDVGILGQKKIKAVTLSQKGKMKLNPDQKNWYEAEAEQHIRVDIPGYLWQVNIPMFKILNIKGRDLFINGEGAMEIRIASLIPVVNENGNKKIDESSLHRFLMELPWYPTAAIEDYISWEEVSGETAKATMNYKGMSVEAKFYFSENGNLKKIESIRYKETDKDAKRIPCIGEIKGYTMVEGLKIPNIIDITWLIDKESFTWYKLENYNMNFVRKE